MKATLSGSQQIRDSRFKREQRALPVEPARITCKAAFRTDDTVAGHDDADRIAPGRGARSARAAREPGAARELAVGDGLAETDSRDCLPHDLLKRPAFGTERGFEARALAAQVFGQLPLRV